jgi:hypothetical protein
MSRPQLSTTGSSITYWGCDEEKNSLFSCMYHRQWDNVSRILFKRMGTRPRCSLKELAAELNSEFDEMNVGVLHILCRFQPPAELLGRIVKTWGEGLVSERDAATGQYPLHVACQHGCLSAIVTLLLELFPEAAMIPDTRGQLPLHLACRPKRWYPTSEFLDDEWKEEEKEAQLYIQPGSDVIYVLCQQVPQSSNVNDVEDRNALEIAIEGGVATKKICKIIMDASHKAQRIMLAKQIKNQSPTTRPREDETMMETDDSLDASLPGNYTAAAAKERLRRCRSDASEDSPSTEGGASFCQLSSSLPPYQEMLHAYKLHTEGFFSPSASPPKPKKKMIHLVSFPLRQKRLGACDNGSFVSGPIIGSGIISAASDSDSLASICSRSSRMSSRNGRSFKSVVTSQASIDLQTPAAMINKNHDAFSVSTKQTASVPEGKKISMEFTGGMSRVLITLRSIASIRSIQKMRHRIGRAA